jgi:phosphatidylglycerophosphatase A
MIIFNQPLSYWIALGFGVGRLRPAPGTWGSLLGMFLGIVLVSLQWPNWINILLCSCALFLGGPICQKAGVILKQTDHPSIVWDEIVAVLWLLILCPIPSYAWLWNISALILFRLFDITKPWPIRWMDQHIKNGWGVMLDDIIAAIFAWCSSYLLTSLVIQFLL